MRNEQARKRASAYDHRRVIAWMRGLNSARHRLDAGLELEDDCELALRRYADDQTRRNATMADEWKNAWMAQVLATNERATR